MNDEEKEKRKLAREQRKAQEAMDVNDEEESGQEAADGDGEVEEVVDEEDYSIALRGDEIAMNENDLLRIPEGFVHEDPAMAEALQSMETKLYACPKCSPRKVLVGEKSMKIHMQECHDKSIQAEHDAIDGRLT